ncbi:MAG: hypothetical protein JWL75_422 [Parcubacteria group bacterium]|nr:hypothetical protein [Parcubacteria group bacterium]
MKILHLANWNSTNIGNGALIYGTQHIIAEDFPEPVEFIPEAWDDYTFKRKFFDEKFVDLVNQHDALLVNGAVTFNAFRKQMRNTGMRFDLPLPLWDAIKKPIILYGLSYRCWPFQAYPNSGAMRRMFEYVIHSENIYFGVRNDGTKEWIKDRFGIESDRIKEIPDPGLFVPYEEHDYPEFTPARKNIMVAFNGEDPIYRFATGLERFVIKAGQGILNPEKIDRLVTHFSGYKKERHRIISEMARAVERIAAEVDAQFILVPHYLDDYGMIQEFIEVIQERIAHQLVVTTGLVAVPHTAYFYGRYKQADLALSMRVHSMSPSIGLNTPVIPVTSQGRMRNFLKKAGLSDIGVDVSQKGFGKELAERAIKLLKSPEAFKEESRKAVEVMRETSRKNNADVYRFITKE